MHFVCWMACKSCKKYSTHHATARMCAKRTRSIQIVQHTAHIVWSHIDAVFSFHSSPVKFINRCLGWHDFIIHVVRCCLCHLFISLCPYELLFLSSYVVCRRSVFLLFLFFFVAFCCFVSCSVAFDFVLSWECNSWITVAAFGRLYYNVHNTQPAINNNLNSMTKPSRRFNAYIPADQTVEWHIESWLRWCGVGFAIASTVPKFMSVAAAAATAATAHELS